MKKCHRYISEDCCCGPSASSMDQVSGFPDNDESPSSSPWDPPSTDFSGGYYQPDEDSPDRQWQDQVSGVPDNNQGPSSSTWNVQGTDVSGEYRQPDEVTLAVSQLSLERADRGLIPASSSNTGATQLPGPLPWYQDPVLRDFGQFIGDLVDLLWQMLPPLEDNRQSTDALMGIRHMASLIVNQVGKYDPVEYGHTEEFQSISEEFERIGKQWGEDFSQNYGRCTTMINLVERMTYQREAFEKWCLEMFQDNQRPVSYDEAADPEQCVICQNHLATNEKVSSLPCKHLYHPECIHLWLTKEMNCPVCRANPWAIYAAKYEL
ncbi:hypothetical protein SeMB42_g05008 [Synchytrium endobioticum]|uniref:RING-type domain-containing protein n=1 Tax=Synchytrium endobioticum TaxID=286115 RepID=A0A507CUI2_9FUNG|nr:hypothetical protein SeMB42_g05008 [Synchytrium endobioticum]